MSRAASSADRPASKRSRASAEQVLPVLLDPAHAGLVRERAVARHDGVDVEIEDAIARADPVADRTVPGDRVAADEQDVAREDDPVGRDVHDRVAARVGGADLDEVHVLVSDPERQAARRTSSWESQFDALEVEGAELVDDELRGRRRTMRRGGRRGARAASARAADAPAEPQGEARRADQGLHERGRQLAHLGRRAPRRHDLGAGDELVAPAVVAVRVRVDHRSRCSRRRECAFASRRACAASGSDRRGCRRAARLRGSSRAPRCSSPTIRPPAGRQRCRRRPR